MMSFKRKQLLKIALPLTLSVCSATSALATQSGLYVGFELGQSTFHDDAGALNVFDAPTSSNEDDSDTAWAIGLGYRFNPYIGIEGSYRDLGALKFNESGRSFGSAGRVLTGNAVAEASAKGPALVVIGSLPSGNWEFSAKLGIFMAKTELAGGLNGTLTQPGFLPQSVSSSFNESANTTETLAGVSVGYTFAEHSHLKLEWTRIPKVGDADKTGEDDVTIISAGYQYRF